MINMIVAYDQNRGIGKDGELLWQPGEMSEDMKRFRVLTRDSSVIMGRRTLESIGMALPKRRNIVVSRNPEFHYEGVETAASVDDALDMSSSQEVFVIGGQQIYQAALERAKRIYATEVQASVEGADTFFPKVGETWSVTSREHHDKDEKNLYPFDFVTYERFDEYLNIANVRSDAQREVFEHIANEAECPFCGENFERYNPNILRRGENWVVAPNRWPYEHTDTHLIAVPTYHAETLADLRKDSFNELLGHMQWAEREYNVRAGGIAMRFGDTALNGSSVKHLHAHFIVPSANKPDGAKVKFKIS